MKKYNKQNQNIIIINLDLVFQVEPKKFFNIIFFWILKIKDVTTAEIVIGIEISIAIINININQCSKQKLL